MPTVGRVCLQAKLLLQRPIGPARVEPLHVNAVGDHANLFGRATLVRRQIAAVRLGHGDEGVGQRRQQAIGKLDVVRQPGRVQRRTNHRHAGQPTGQPPPKHLVAARADGHHGVDPPLPHQLTQPPKHGEHRICVPTAR